MTLLLCFFIRFFFRKASSTFALFFTNVLLLRLLTFLWGALSKFGFFAYNGLECVTSINWCNWNDFEWILCFSDLTVYINFASECIELALQNLHRFLLQLAEDEASGDERGRVLLSLSYSSTQQKLTIGVVRCAQLPSMDSNGYSDPFVKMWVLL